MKQKKFPILPVAILGVAVVVGAIMISNKPLVGDIETVMTAKMQRERAASEEASKGKIAGDSRTPATDATLKNELAKSMKGAEPDAGGNMGLRDQKVMPLLTTGVPKQVKKVPVNPAVPSTGWYRKEYRGDKDK